MADPKDNADNTRRALDFEMAATARHCKSDQQERLGLTAMSTWQKSNPTEVQHSVWLSLSEN